MKKFSFKDFVELNVKELLVVNGGANCSSGYTGGCAATTSGAPGYSGSPTGGSSYSYSHSSSSSSGSSAGGGCSSPSSSKKSGKDSDSYDSALSEAFHSNYGGLGAGCGSCSSTKTTNEDTGDSGNLTNTEGNSSSTQIQVNSNGGTCSGISKNDVYEEFRANELKKQATFDGMVDSIKENRKQKYICTGNAETDYRCDNWVQEVLTDAGIDYKSYMAGDAKEFCVQNHIDNLVNNKVEGKDYTKSVPTEKGVYVVFMNDGHDYKNSKGETVPMPPHTGILIVDGENGSSSRFYDNSSCNESKGVDITAGKGGVFISSAGCMNQFGYDSFYYQKIVAN